MVASLPYREPSIEGILILSSFLLTLNIINSILDRTLYCGLVGQVLVGIAWGTPGGKWLSESLEDSIVQLGYLGLIMIVFEGGLSSSIATMKANLLLSACVAITGVVAPMGLSFFLSPMVGASPIQCFAAGAALCSTSLGTTFTVLSTSGLVSTRLGSVLSTAAMMDDVVGLVMVQIVSSLGSGNTEISPVTVIRPIFVSLAFSIVVPLACRYVVRPSMSLLSHTRGEHVQTEAVRLSRTKQTVFVVQTILLLALVTGASYAGASVLLAAYLAGIIGAYWEDKTIKAQTVDTTSDTPSTTRDGNPLGNVSPVSAIPESTACQASAEREARPAPDIARTSPSEMYEHYYVQPIERILKAFFFASVGFSIPIGKMFSSAIVWRGIIYTILMLLGKAICGAWLVRFSIPVKDKAVNFKNSPVFGAWAVLQKLPLGKLIHQFKKQPEKADDEVSGSQTVGASLREPQMSTTVPPVTEKSKSAEKPLSLYPAGIMSCAMIARGEIGFLISSVAESNGIFFRSSTLASTDESSEIFLIITWAIVLCTVIGPFCVGLLVRRVKSLEAARIALPVDDTKNDVLGVWGLA